MLKLLTGYFARRRLRGEQDASDRVAVNTAIAAFRQSAGMEPIHSMCRVVHRGDDGKVVRVCHGTTRPPSRRWFLVADGAGGAREMAGEEVLGLVQEIWR